MDPGPADSNAPAAGAPAPVRRRARLWVEIGVNLALLMVAVSVLDAGVFLLATRYVMAEASVDLAESAAVVVAAEVGAAPPEQWPAIVEENRHRGLRGLAVWEVKDGLVVGEEGEVDATMKRTVATREVNSEILGDDVRVVAPVGAGRPTAVVSLRYPLARIQAPAWGVVVGHAVFSALVIVGFGLFLFRRNVVDPIQRISAATERIAGGEFLAPVPADAPEELAALAGSLASLGAALADYQTRTAQQLASLEAANAQLRTAQDALVRTEKLASVGRLAAGLAHELGNPLAAVRGYVELLAGSEEAGSNAEILRRAQLDVERMHRLLRNLLDFARGDESAPAPLDVAELVEEAAATVRHQVVFRGIKFVVSAEDVGRVNGEVTKLHQVLVNLLLNAADARASRVELNARREAGEVVIEVADDGEGIPPQNVARLFEPFFTTRAPGRGTGLGLAIAFRVAEQHGGRIVVRSTLGKGSRFALHLPA